MLNILTIIFLCITLEIDFLNFIRVVHLISITSIHKFECLNYLLSEISDPVMDDTTLL